jgi:membrane glycosyltransferase
MIFSTLLAPVMALLQTRFVGAILLGRKVRWDTQERGESGTSFREAFRRHQVATLLGVGWGLLLLFAARSLFWWFLPVLLGLIVSIPVSAWTSRASAGQWARARGLFLTPEELDPPPILLTFAQELEKTSRRPWADSRDGLAWVLADPSASEIHLSLLMPSPAPPDPLQQHYVEGLRLKLVHSGLQSLTSREKRDLLLDPESIRALRGRPLPAAA